MLIYLADLVNNYLRGSNTVPLNVAYLAAYAKAQHGEKIEIRIFKYLDNLLDAVDREQPALIGFSNYTWNYNLNNFAGRYIKQNYPKIITVMGGPNIRLDNEGVKNFLKANNYIDIYCMLEGEIAFSRIVGKLLDKDVADRTSEFIKGEEMDSCFSLMGDRLLGNRRPCIDNIDLDYLPSPYLSGILDPFFEQNLIPLIETNRGCPYSCVYCGWGVAERSRIRRFSLERVKSEIDYISSKCFFPYWIVADANFGILERDIEIAAHIRKVYDEKKPFNRMVLYWDKSARDNMVEIAKILKGLSMAYIAFQSFDPFVLETIGRRNITIERLKDISQSLSKYSERLHTDILLGLPGETMQSHLNSLNSAIEYGFDSIGGGEVRLLMGSRLETDELRKKFGLKTKYRLVQEGFGIYRGKLIYELEESIRATNWISEDEMLRLRVIRAIFYGSVSIGEFLPLIKYLRQRGIKVMDFIQKLVEEKKGDEIVEGSFRWLNDKAKSEWFDTQEEAEEYFKDEKNIKKLLDNPTVKLNFDFISYLLLSTERYDSFCRHMISVISRCFNQCDMKIVDEILKFCRKRNYIMRVLNGDESMKDSIVLSPDTIEMLGKARLLFGEIDKEKGKFDLMMDGLDGKYIVNYIKEIGDKKNIQAVSILLESVSGYLMKITN